MSNTAMKNQQQIKIVDAKFCIDAEMGDDCTGVDDSAPSSEQHSGNRYNKNGEMIPTERDGKSITGGSETRAASFVGLCCIAAAAFFVGAVCLVRGGVRPSYYAADPEERPAPSLLLLGAAGLADYPVVARATFHGGPADADAALETSDLDSLGRGERVVVGGPGGRSGGGIIKTFLLHNQDDASALDAAVTRAENGGAWIADRERTDRLRNIAENNDDEGGVEKYDAADRGLEAAGGYETINNFPCYRTVDGTLQTLLDLEAAYPYLATVEQIGASFHGRGIYVLKLTDSGSSAPKAPLLITAGVHAREFTPPELVTRFAEHCVQNHGADADIDWILAHREIHLIVHANPDGRSLAERHPDTWWRKNANSAKCNDGWYGVDLNRNFNFKWGGAGASTDPCATTYRGDSAGSESETEAIMEYSKSIFSPGQRKEHPVRDVDAPYDEPTSTGMYIDVHSAGEDVIFPWGHKDMAVGNYQAYRALSHKLCSFNNYQPSGSGDSTFLGAVSGDSLDYHYGELGVCSILFEIGTEFYQSCYDFETTILPDNLNALIYSAKLAHLPYEVAKGPDVMSLSVPSGPLSSATVAVIRATVSDQERTKVPDLQSVSSGNQPIASVELFVGGHPYDSPRPQARLMSTVDGGSTFNSHTEEAALTLQLSALPEGRSMICVVATDAAGFEGPVSCDYLTVRPAQTTTTTTVTSATTGGLSYSAQQQQTTASSGQAQQGGMQGAKTQSTTTTAFPAVEQTPSVNISQKCTKRQLQGDCKKSDGCKWSKNDACLDICEGEKKEDKCLNQKSCTWDSKGESCTRRLS